MLHSSCMLLRSNVKNVMLVIRINRSSYIFCGSVVEHRSAEPEGLDSISYGDSDFFLLLHARDQREKNESNQSFTAQ